MAKKPNEKELTEKTKERIQKLLKKGRSPAGAKFEATAPKGWSKPKKKVKKSRGTRQVEKRLRRSLTEEEIRSLGGR